MVRFVLRSGYIAFLLNRGFDPEMDHSKEDVDISDLSNIHLLSGLYLGIFYREPLARA